MRTVQRTYTLFGIAELEDEARQRAYTDWLAKGNDYPYASENCDTLEAFCNLSVSSAPTTVTTVAHTLTVSIPSTRRTRRNFQASACWLTSITTSMRGCTSPKSIGRKTARKDAGAVSPSLANAPSRALCRTKSSCNPSWTSCARPTHGISRNSCVTVWKTSSARAETIASIARARSISRTRATGIIGSTLSTGHFSRKRHEAGNQTERENRPLQRGRS